MTERRILLVDDDRAIVQAISIRLGALGYRTVAAHDGAAGLATARSERFDAMVLDIRMPGLNGLTVLDRLRQHSETRDLPVVMLSASVVDQQDALDRGASYFLQKPYEPQALVSALVAAIRNKQKGPTACPPNAY